MRIAAGRGAGHAAPVTPLALVQESVVLLTDPASVAVPLQIVLSAAVPVNAS
jgi:hypothetical protein